MGIGPFSHDRYSSDDCGCCCYTPTPKNNPDPSNYFIVFYEKIGVYLIVLIQYPDCTNYEGRKILVYDGNLTIDSLKRQGKIDPHFSDNVSYKSPVARFEPTKKGWNLAVKFCKS